MRYRTIEIAWMPRTTTEWTTFTASRREAARLWSDLVVRPPPPPPTGLEEAVQGTLAALGQGALFKTRWWACNVGG